MSTGEQNDGPDAWILLPEIIGVSFLALLLPLPLVHLLLAGHAVAAIAGFSVWLSGVFLALRFIRQRQYGRAYLPMLVIIGLFLILYKLCQ